jgi:hypothetical protein
MKTPATLLAIALAAPLHAGSTNQKTTPPVGAYQPANPDPDAENAARFAIARTATTESTTLRLERILSLEKQVVAGLNFKLHLAVSDGARTREALAIVWQKLDGELELTSWKWL